MTSLATLPRGSVRHSANITLRNSREQNLWAPLSLMYRGDARLTILYEQQGHGDEVRNDRDP